MIAAPGLLVVDGYNVIRAYERYSDLIDDDPGAFDGDVYHQARKLLIADVASFAKGTHKAVVVFDGFGNVNPERPPLRTAGVDVVFSPTGVEADTIIEQIARTERERGTRVTVVTSDSFVQSTVFGEGVTILSARNFAAEATLMNEGMVPYSTAPAAPIVSHATLESRIAPDTREALRQMALPRKARKANERP